MAGKAVILTERDNELPKIGLRSIKLVKTQCPVSRRLTH